MNRNHNIPKGFFECLKCGQTWERLYYKSLAFERLNFAVSAIDFVNRALPCLSDEEAIVKKLLE